MQDKDILDVEMMDDKKEAIWEGIEWWENNRLLYNILLIALEVFLMTTYWVGTKRFGIGNSIVQSLLYTIAANVFFSMGWGLEVWVRYHFNGYYIGKKARPIFLVLGIIFSLILTWELYIVALVYH